MRLGRKIIDHMAKTVAHRLLENDLVITEMSEEAMIAELHRLIVADLVVEDHLNEEVKEILRAHSKEMDRNNVDYARMFSMVKRQLARERGLIL